MSPGVQIVLSGALSFGVPLVLAARELIVLRRRGGGGGGRGAPPVPPPGPPLSWQPSLPSGPWYPAPLADDGPGHAPVRIRELA